MGWLEHGHCAAAADALQALLSRLAHVLCSRAGGEYVTAGVGTSARVAERGANEGGNTLAHWLMCCIRCARDNDRNMSMLALPSLGS